MENFEKIKTQWGAKKLPLSPADGPQKVIAAAKRLKRKQTQSQIILTSTVIILVLFFFYVSAYESEIVSWGLGLMIFSLVIRIMLEFFSKAKLQKISVNQEVTQYKSGLFSYYQSRKWVHYLFTPVLFILYFVGFSLLMPVFKETLSGAFYNYIFYSSIIIFLFFGFFIGVQIRREMRTLQQLKKMD